MPLAFSHRCSNQGRESFRDRTALVAYFKIASSWQSGISYSHTLQSLNTLLVLFCHWPRRLPVNKERLKSSQADGCLRQTFVQLGPECPPFPFLSLHPQCASVFTKVSVPSVDEIEQEWGTAWGTKRRCNERVSLAKMISLTILVLSWYTFYLCWDARKILHCEVQAGRDKRSAGRCREGRNPGRQSCVSEFGGQTDRSVLSRHGSKLE
jgi:hypothetical protein